MDVVFPILELLDYFANENYHELGYSVEVTLSELLAWVDLAVEGIEADIDETFDFELTKEVTKGSALLRPLPSVKVLVKSIVIHFV